MKIVNPAGLPVATDDHPTGALGFRYLLRGTENTPENFVMLLAENLGEFRMIRHRHNFDQFRYVISGQMNLGDGLVIREGELCYFPEGTPYGPQEDPPGPLVLVLQFGGCSGYGYMSPEQYLRGRDELSQVGRFEGSIYLREEAGRVTRKFSINAIWEQVMGSRMLIPAPRYEQPIIMKPKAYRWVPVARQPQCHHKLLGVFSERGTAASLYRVASGSIWTLLPDESIRLLFVLEGSGSAQGQTLGKHFAVQVSPGERAELRCDTELTVMVLSLPSFAPGWRDAEIEAAEPAFEESVDTSALPA